jgi:hypothetical protein
MRCLRSTNCLPPVYSIALYLASRSIALKPDPQTGVVLHEIVRQCLPTREGLWPFPQSKSAAYTQRSRDGSSSCCPSKSPGFRSRIGSNPALNKVCSPNPVPPVSDIACDTDSDSDSGMLDIESSSIVCDESLSSEPATLDENVVQQYMNHEDQPLGSTANQFLSVIFMYLQSSNNWGCCLWRHDEWDSECRPRKVSLLLPNINLMSSTDERVLKVVRLYN